LDHRGRAVVVKTGIKIQGLGGKKPDWWSVKSCASGQVRPQGRFDVPRRLGPLRGVWGGCSRNRTVEVLVA